MNSFTIGEFVSRNVIYCVSSLVSELAKIAEHLPDSDDAEQLYSAFSVPDYQEACEQQGWKELGGEIVHEDRHEDDGYYGAYPDWQDCADGEDIEPYQREVFEHWIVDRWFANKLEQKGEMILRDFMGIRDIWCRTTTGQAICCDRVVKEIYEETQN